MLEIEEEARNAAPEEQERLALFTSFGAGDLANNLFRRSPEDAFPKGWDSLGQDLEQLVSPAELASLARVTQYAHFTPEFMVRAIWRALSRMGFSGGRVLEPGCGTGLFFALMPEALETKTTLTGVEMDPVTARISKLLERRVANDEVVGLGDARLGEVLGADARIRMEEKISRLSFLRTSTHEAM